MSELLVARAITKSFPGVRALDSAGLCLRRGEIHALLGENGAGKSTLIKILTGACTRDSGSVLFEGREIAPTSPREAEACGISTVYQEVNLVPTLSVAENVVLGRQPGRFGMIDWRSTRDRAAAALARLGLKLDLRCELGSYPIAIQQLVAIARALDVQARLLILDEPTSSLDEKECGALFRILRRLRDEGMGILFVTHFLDQVYQLTDRITVLRNGTFVGEWPTASLPRLELIARMLGRETSAPRERHGSRESLEAPQAHGLLIPPVLEARGLGRRGALHPTHLAIHAGEVLGLAGLLGSGRTEMARMLFGVDAHDTGEIRVNGRPAPMRSPREAIRLGMAFCSEDRKSEGIVPHLSVRENLVLAMQGARGVLRRLPRAEQERIADHYIRALNIRTPSAETPISSLSGGNQQKVLLARWLALQPKVILLDEPTRGIDIGAKAEIEKLVGSLREKGMSVLFISSELEEIVRVAGRVAVLRDRRNAGELHPPIDEHRIMERIAGTGSGSGADPAG